MPNKLNAGTVEVGLEAVDKNLLKTLKMAQQQLDATAKVVERVNKSVTSAMSIPRLTAEVDKLAYSLKNGVQPAINQMNAANKAASKTSRMSAAAITNLGYAAEDALTVIGTQGLSGALRAAGNNLSFVAALMNPVAGIVVGISTALAASLIPMLERTSETSRQAASHLQTLGQQARRAYIDLTQGRDGIGAIEVEPVVPVNLDRFETQRKTFEADLASMEEKVAHFQRETGFVLGKFQQSLPTELSSGFFSDPLGQYDFDLTRVQEVIRGKLSDGLRESIERGSALPLEEAGKNVQEYIKAISASTGGHSLEEILPSESFKTVMDDLFDISRQSILAEEGIQGITQALDELGKNQAINRDMKSFVDALQPVFQVGGRFEDRFKALVDSFQREFTGPSQALRMQAFGENDPLQAGFQWGSREAVSAVNQASFWTGDDDGKKIADNTSETVDAVIDVGREVRNMRTAVTNAIINSFSVGAPL